MSVFTSVKRTELAAALSGFDVGGLDRFEGISTGIENSNYHVWCETGRYVLTLFETVARDDLPYLLGLTGFYAGHGLPCARALRRRDGRRLFELHGKAAVLVEYLPGRSETRPNPAQCEALGRMLGRMHRLGAGFDRHRPNPRGAEWRARMLVELRGLWSEQDHRLARDEVTGLQVLHQLDLPRGPVHCDLFRDNVLFESDRISGLLDFYYACDDLLVYDLAIAVNDWAHVADGRLDPVACGAVLRGYAAERGLLEAEREAWNLALRAAAVRFWLSRALDLARPRPGALTYAKDPQEFKRILLVHRAQNHQPCEGELG